MRAPLLVLLVAALIVCSTSLKQPPHHAAFYAAVRYELVEDGIHWLGGGIYAYDEVHGNIKMDVTLLDSAGNQRHLHKFNYGNETFEFVEDKCVRSPSTMTEDLFSWASEPGVATLVGKDQYLGHNIKIWESKEQGDVRTLAVNDKHVPVYHLRHSQNLEETDYLRVTVLSYTTKIPNHVFYLPNKCQPGLENVGDTNAVVAFAQNNWNCANVACSSRVPAGTGQPGYACAEFVARSLAAGGYIPGLGATSPQGSFGSYRGYDLLLTTGLSSALGNILGFRKVAASASSINAAYPAFGDGGDGYFSHAVIGVAAGTVDAHNNARQNYPAAYALFKGVDAVWAP